MADDLCKPNRRRSGIERCRNVSSRRTVALPPRIQVNGRDTEYRLGHNAKVALLERVATSAQYTRCVELLDLREFGFRRLPTGR